MSKLCTFLRLLTLITIINVFVVLPSHAQKSINDLPRATAEIIQKYNITPKKIYNYARLQNKKALIYLRDFINLTDKQTLTALCYAQKAKDKNAYELLIKAGASRNVMCHDDEDPICSIAYIDNNSNELSNWLIGGILAGGAIWGAAEILGDDDKETCPRGYSIEKYTPQMCGQTGLDGWIYETYGKIGDKDCGKCTPKTCNTGDTNYQTVEDCGQTAQAGWEYTNDGFSGDLKCGLCSPKQCQPSSSTHYFIKEHCPQKQYMIATSTTETGKQGDDTCYECQYQCDEITGFANETTCKQNANGEIGYICVQDAVSQCYYKQSEASCPAEYSTLNQEKSDCAKNNGGTTEGWDINYQGYSGNLQCSKCVKNTCTCNNDASCILSNVSTNYTSQDKCPTKTDNFFKDRIVRGYSGSDICYECTYTCDNSKGAYDTKQECLNQYPSYTCDDFRNNCYYKGSAGACPTITVDGQQTTTATGLTPTSCSQIGVGSGWEIIGTGTYSGTKECKYCKTKACVSGDPQYKTVEDCGSTGASGWSISQNYYTGDSLCGLCTKKSCPSSTNPISTSYTSTEKCPSKTDNIIEKVVENGKSGEDTCYECNYYCDNSKGAYKTKQECLNQYPTYKCNEFKNNCYYKGSSGDCPDVEVDGKIVSSATGITAYSCSQIGVSSGWEVIGTGTYSGTLECKYCKPKACTSGNSQYQSASDCGTTGSRGYTYDYNGYSGDDYCGICTPKTCYSYNDEIPDVSENCYITVENIAEGYNSSISHYAGETPCYNCQYDCKEENGYYNYYQDCIDNLAIDGNDCSKVDTYTNCYHEDTSGVCSSGTSSLYSSISNCPYYDKYPDIVSNQMSGGIDTDGQPCYECIYTCQGSVIEGDVEKEIVDDNDCSEYYGWNCEKIHDAPYPDTNCVLKSAMTECTKGGEVYIKTWKDCPPGGNENSWTLESSGYIGGQECKKCTAVECYEQGYSNASGVCDRRLGFKSSDSIITNIYFGNVPCKVCECKHDASLTTCPDGSTPKTNELYGMSCKYCPEDEAELASLTHPLQQTLINHTTGDYIGSSQPTVKATGENPIEKHTITIHNSSKNSTISLKQSDDTNTILYNSYASTQPTSKYQAVANATLNIIQEENAENNTLIALKSSNDVYNAYADNNSIATANINIEDIQNNTNEIYGIYAQNNAYNAKALDTSKAYGNININTITQNRAIGIYATNNIYNTSSENENSQINIKGASSGNIYGLYSKQGSIKNSGDINITSKDGQVYGIYLENGNNQSIENTGNITLNTSSTAYGIYVKDGGSKESGVNILNTGTINITANNLSKGIKIENNGANAKVENSGTIIVNNQTNDSNAIDLNGATLTNKGTILSTNQLNLSSFNATHILDGGTYVAESIKGDTLISSKSSLNSNQDTYTTKQAFQTKDVSNLNVSHESALYDAKLIKNENNSYDVQSTRKNFNNFTDNASLSNYLEQNYKNGNLTNLYNKLKEKTTKQALAKEIYKKTGADFLINLPQENINTIRHTSEIITDAILKPTNEINRVISGVDTYLQETDGKTYTTGYENQTTSTYMFGDKKINNNNRLGIGLAILQTKSNYDNGIDRKENIISIFLPWLHQFTDTLRLSTILNIGYGFGDYEKHQTKTDIKDYIYSITNKLTYDVNLNDYAMLEPQLIFNAIGYYQDDMIESHNDDPLRVKSGNHLSTEVGVGLFIKKNLIDKEKQKLNLRIGGIYYQELNNPHKNLNAGFIEGNGYYKITDIDDIYDHNRAILEASLDYEYKDLSLYLKYNHLLQSNKSKIFDFGIKYNF